MTCAHISTKGHCYLWLELTMRCFLPCMVLLLHMDKCFARHSSAAPSCGMKLHDESNTEESVELTHFQCTSLDVCQDACCNNTECSAFTFTTYQPADTGICSKGSQCCWLKRWSTKGKLAPKSNCTSGIRSGAPVPPAPPGLQVPSLSLQRIIADDPTGNLRDPSAMIQDPNTLLWHFWVVYMPGATEPGWNGFLHHYVSSNSSLDTCVWENHGLALNHSSDPNAYDAQGMFSPSALYDPNGSNPGWYLFYSGCGANHSTLGVSAQLVAHAASPDGPWERLGLVAWPLGNASENWSKPWNARRLDSGRALTVNGKRGYWTKGVSRTNFAQEGVYFPNNADAFAPPYSEWTGNPLYAYPVNSGGYENCEFFRGPDAYLHILCQNHEGGQQPHFVTPLGGDGLNWTLTGTVTTKPALEPTPVYEGSIPGDTADVRYFIARTESGRKGPGALVIGLYALTWRDATL
eukprot:m.297419 g.297419  ORF g.297419 m.297419 type:complete len:463 (+) comp20080_c0_seq2:74-1462(+)